MRDEEDCHAAVVGDLVHLAEALALKGKVADREHLVDDENIRPQMRGDGEGEPHVHPAGVAFHRRIEELLGLGEGHDAVEFPVDLAPVHPQQRAVEINILAPGQLGVKAGADFEQRAHPAEQIDFAAGRRGDLRQDFEEGGFPRAVAADDAEHFAAPHFEGNVGERAELFFPSSTRERFAQLLGDQFGQRGRPMLPGSQAEAFADMADRDDALR